MYLLSKTLIGALLAASWTFHTHLTVVDAHGHMTTPRTRNWYAHEEGSDIPTIGSPPKDYCPHCLNVNNGVCGYTTYNDYDDYKDGLGNPMPWLSQETYVEGQDIVVKSYLDTHHNGHMTLTACPLGNESTNECFASPDNELTFVRDTLYDMPQDPNYPGRGMYAGGQGGGIKEFEMIFRLPNGVYGDNVMLQYRYITANSCSPPGYEAYFSGGNSANTALPDSYWTKGVEECSYPLPDDGTRSEVWPEQFYNCAEITIIPGAPTISPKPSPAPTTAAPTFTSEPTSIPASWCCSWGGVVCEKPEDVYCQASQSNCEGSCTGNWIIDGDGGGPTTPSNPTAAPVSASPVSTIPTVPGTACCTIDFKECSPTVVGFCSESQENCEGPCDKWWLPNGPLTDCTARFDPCSTDSECCDPGVCGTGGYCEEPENPVVCTVRGLGCSHDTDCCDDDLCLEAQCSDPDVCTARGLECSHDSECCDDDLCLEAQCSLPEDTPTKSPTTPPTPSPTVSMEPTKPPVTTPPTPPVSSFSCSDGVGTSSVNMLGHMDAITNIVSEDPYMLSVLASGGASGDGSYVVTESQAYGVLAAALAIVSLDESDSQYEETLRKFEGYFNGWKKMCIESLPVSPCQSTKYCNGNPCLPGWKHAGDLSNVVGTGAAPDGDEDAIAGMIIALKAVEDDATRPSWYEEVYDWADKSCTQFLVDNTVLSDSGNHRLLKLGTCWGGWENNGNNPSYHSPGQWRMFRDFQASVISRDYVLPSLDAGVTWTEKWNMLIDTAYKFLETTKCDDSSLVPNWALVAESSTTLVTHPGSFSGSGTPQYEFGAEASRTMWRIAFDAAVYPVESEDSTSSFLEPLLGRMVDNFDTNSQLHFASDTLSACSPTVSNVFGSWQYNGFIFGPVYSTLVKEIAQDAFQGKSFSQQDMVDAVCDLVDENVELASYYPKSWQILAMMTLNGELGKVGALMGGTGFTPSPVPAPTLSPVSSPTIAPVTPPTLAPVDPPTPSPVMITSSPTTAAPQTSPVASPTEAPVSGAPTVSPVPAPTRAPTTAPTSPAPTKVPTKAPTSPAPTKAPTKAPTPDNGDKCCSWNQMECEQLDNSYCQGSQSNCEGSCNGFWIDPNNLPSCITLYQPCLGDENNCCSGSSCVGNQYHKQCNPTS